MIELLIIADDVTGALDTGCQFGKRGISTAVYPGGVLPWQALPPGLRVAVVNTDSRHLPAAQARERVHRLALEGIRHGVLRIFKKIDSALRGNLDSELQALLDTGICDRLYLLPAYPDSGRTTENGLQLLNGRGISRSDYGRDPFSPVPSSRITDLLSGPVHTVPLTAPLPEEPGLWVLDAVSNSHLEARCREFPAGPLLIAGCAGLAAALAGHMAPEVLPPVSTPGPCRKLLIVSGSLHPVSRAQIGRAHAAGIPRVTCSGSPEAAAHALAEAFRHSSAAILEAPASREPGCAPGIMAESLAHAVQLLYETEAPLTLAVFGGDTLLAIAARLFREALCPLAEVLPGVPVSKTRDHEGRRLCLISKSGGFGPENVVEQITAYVFSENQGGNHNDTNHARHL